MSLDVSKSENLVITQARLGTKLTYEFRDLELEYTLRDYSGELQFVVRYDAIVVPSAYSMAVRDVPFARRMVLIPLFVLSVGVAMLLFGQTAAAVAGLLLGIVMSLPFLLIRPLNLFTVQCTMLPMSPAPLGAGKRHIRIMHGSAHADVLGEIRHRWTSRMRTLHAKIDFSNDADKEIAKFNWLRDSSVISEEECREAIEKIHIHRISDRIMVERNDCN